MTRAIVAAVLTAVTVLGATAPAHAAASTDQRKPCGLSC